MHEVQRVEVRGVEALWEKLKSVEDALCAADEAYVPSSSAADARDFGMARAMFASRILASFCSGRPPRRVQLDGLKHVFCNSCLFRCFLPP